jgi:hypothetical protein
MEFAKMRAWFLADAAISTRYIKYAEYCPWKKNSVHEATQFM